jgi:hypothetical protein
MIPPYEGSSQMEHVQIETGLSGIYQLYNLTSDPSQLHNLAEENPMKLREMVEHYEAVR